MGTIALDPTEAPRIAHRPDVGADDPVSIGDRFAQGLAARDYKAVFGSFTPDVRFRYLIPPGPGEAIGAADVAAKFFDWFWGADVLELESVLVSGIGDRLSVRYRFVMSNSGEKEVVEQQTFMDLDEQGRIVALDLLCSGFRSADEGSEVGMSETHRFDAGTLSCADGLAGEFRRQLQAISVGDVLEVQTIDPAAKEDLPPLARMMGNRVLSIEPSEDGRLLITVERGR
jgi:TusA-related sulfurtransferase